MTGITNVRTVSAMTREQTSPQCTRNVRMRQSVLFVPWWTSLTNKHWQDLEWNVTKNWPPCCNLHHQSCSLWTLVRSPRRGGRCYTRPFASYYAAKERSFDMWQMLAFSQCSIPIKLLHLLKGWGDVWCQLSKIASAVGYHDDHRSQIAAVKSASHGIITGSGSCNRKTPRRNRELTEKCSKLPGVVCGITPLARCIPVEERRFLDGECLSTFSLDSDKTQCVALNVCLGQVLSSKNCFY